MSLARRSVLRGAAVGATGVGFATVGALPSLAEATPAGTQMHQRIRSQRTQVLYDCLERLPAEISDELLRAVPMLEAVAEELK